jgi:hypothetical protein
VAHAGKGSDSHSPDQIFPADIVLAWLSIWQMPLLLGTAWWKIWLEASPALSPAIPPAHHHDEHFQLVVPEPIEVEGEHALFA